MEKALKENNKINNHSLEKPEVITCNFPKGIIGFPDSKAYNLISDSKLFPFLKLVAVDKEGLIFALMDPWLIKEDYEIKISNEDIKNLDVKEKEDLIILSIVTIIAKKSLISLNLAAPIAINKKKNIGAQLILDDTSLPLQHFVKINE